MRLVVDTNVLFSFFWKDSFTKKLIMCNELELLAPELALSEIRKYKKEICTKTKVSSTDFEHTLQELMQQVVFTTLSDYKTHFQEAKKLSPDKDDADFFAVSLQENLPLWSNDKFLKSQEKITVVNTQELLNLLHF